MPGIKQLEKEIAGALVGKTIKEVRYMTDNEREEQFWGSKAIVIFFTDGSCMFPSADDEGNDAGALFTNIKGLETIGVF